MKFRQYHHRVSNLTHSLCVDGTLLAGLLILLLCSSLSGLAQTDSNLIDVAKLRWFKNDIVGFDLSVQPKGKTTDAAIATLPYNTLQKGLPEIYMERDLFLRFTLSNTSDSVKEVYFLPGFYCKNIRVFQAKPGEAASTLSQIPDSLIKSKRFAGAKLLKILPRDTTEFYCSFNFVRTNVNSYIPRIIEKDSLNIWRTAVRDRDYLLDIVCYISCGIMLLMIFYSLAVYLQNKNKEFLFYSIYTFCTAFLLFLKSFLNVSATEFNYFYEEYLDFMILTASVFTYLFFVRQFINTREFHPKLDRILRWSRIVLIIASTIFSFIYFFTDKYIILNFMENYVIKLIFLVTGISFIVYSIRKKDTLMNYLAAGNLSLVVFSIVSLFFLLFKWKPFPEDSSFTIFNRAMFYYVLGLVLELVFFLSGLAYKNRRDIIERVKERERLKLENERKDFEKQLAVITAMQQERDRISADMHDELGSGVTAIRLMSEILKSKMKGQTFPELEKISSNANELLGKMNTIIWTMKSSNDTVESLVAYIRAHAIEYFDSTPIDCSVRLPAVIPQTDISGEKRRNIFLSVKEALNNAMKHSQATHIHIDIIAKESSLVILVADNGVGINPDQLRRFGNGLNNMRRRMESIGGSFQVDCTKKCVLTFEAPF